MYGMSMAFDPAIAHIVMFGGYGYLGALTFSKGNLNQTWELVHRCWVRVYGATPPSARQGGVLSYDSTDRYLVLFGGFQGSGLKGTPVPLSDTWVFNGTKWAQVSTGASSPPARLYTAASDDSALGGVVLFGGLTPSGSMLNDTWIYSSGSWSQLNPKGPTPEVRFGESMVYLPAANGVFMDWGTTTQSVYYSGYTMPAFVGAPGPWFLT
jgi:hypothetical protein